jgi:hypothetical protein
MENVAIVQEAPLTAGIVAQVDSIFATALPASKAVRAGLAMQFLVRGEQRGRKVFQGNRGLRHPLSADINRVGIGRILLLRWLGGQANWHGWVRTL